MTQIKKYVPNKQIMLPIYLNCFIIKIYYSNGDDELDITEQFIIYENSDDLDDLTLSDITHLLHCWKNLSPNDKITHSLNVTNLTKWVKSIGFSQIKIDKLLYEGYFFSDYCFSDDENSSFSKPTKCSIIWFDENGTKYTVNMIDSETKVPVDLSMM